MATVSLSPAQQKPGETPKQRIPLGVVSDAAVNSPLRGVPAKRSRDYTEARDELPWDPQPHAKRRALDEQRQTKQISPKRQIIRPADARVFHKRSNNVPPTPFERQLLAARDDRQQQSQQRIERQEKSTQQTLKGIKQWQDHYKKAFPMFVFYFEGIPEDVRMRCSKYARNLGAREEKFFSKDVTHIVTTRDIPTGADSSRSTDHTVSSTIVIGSQNLKKVSTINPSILDQAGEQQTHTQSRSKLALDNGTGKALPLNDIRELDQRKGTNGSTDILLKAKEMGMKVWQLEKFQRMIRNLLEIPNDTHTQAGQINRAKPVPTANKGNREAELSRMLRNERLNGPSDRDSTVTATELVAFKGPYIYIRDMDERHKPIIVRDYQRPAKGETGDWPQFHGVSAGRCPFVPEPIREESEVHFANDHELSEERRLDQVRSAPLACAATTDARGVPEQTQQRGSVIRDAKAYDGSVLPAQSPAKGPSQGTFFAPLDKRQSAAQIGHDDSMTTTSRLFGGEPAASGVQPSNITSAIRSQMISSTAAAPGVKAGISKEVHGLQRKVLQKNVDPILTKNQTKMSTVESAALTRAKKALPADRQNRTHVRQPIIHEDEESTQSDEEDIWIAEGTRKRHEREPTCRTKVEVKSKPGYCENCQDKYDDFDEHIQSRKHRKFALTKENWKDLDRLLAHLGRPLKTLHVERF